MHTLDQVYRCELCGNIVQFVHAGPGTLVCCNKPMTLLEEGSVDAATEKHVPIITKTADGYHVSVGSVAHPMGDDHYVEWIELMADGVSYHAFLNPGDKPEADFCVKADKVSAREYCNLHGLWKGEL
ncbi:MAG: desulfoferrodoxin [Calditrichaeota bacterium]|jgi:superoxide reductase|nr:desulfoferrodoxin [Calditrichota bacterium]MBT7617681.1 desulfoferrodoxin [Calditrichota bacterium]MBT7788980.1 desulfoferrodoxin [Calditrichota bacterium]